MGKRQADDETLRVKPPTEAAGEEPLTIKPPPSSAGDRTAAVPPPVASQPASPRKAPGQATPPVPPPVSPGATVSPKGSFLDYLPQSQQLLGQLQPGRVVGDFQLRERIGIGGMGIVYRAERQQTGIEVALKFLINSRADKRQEQLERFRKEAETIASLDHPSIVKVEAVQSIDDLNFMVMELFLGPYGKPVNLVDYSRDFGAANGMLDEFDTKQIFLVLLDAIAYAHANGVVHCDLKPENILFDSLGMESGFWRAHLKLTDFGVAKVVGEEVVMESVTESISRLGAGATVTSDAAALLGTYEYMSPEQRRGEPATPASDIYTVGLMIYRLLTGKTELGLKRPSQLREGIANGWDELIVKALSERAERRFPAAEAMAEALRQI